MDVTKPHNVTDGILSLVMNLTVTTAELAQLALLLTQKEDHALHTIKSVDVLKCSTKIYTPVRNAH
jgi:hypothetical protein